MPLQAPAQRSCSQALLFPEAVPQSLHQQEPPGEEQQAGCCCCWAAAQLQQPGRRHWKQGRRQQSPLLALQWQQPPRLRGSRTSGAAQDAAQLLHDAVQLLVGAPHLQPGPEQEQAGQLSGPLQAQAPAQAPQPGGSPGSGRWTASPCTQRLSGHE